MSEATGVFILSWCIVATVAACYLGWRVWWLEKNYEEVIDELTKALGFEPPNRRPKP